MNKLCRRKEYYNKDNQLVYAVDLNYDNVIEKFICSINKYYTYKMSDGVDQCSLHNFLFMGYKEVSDNLHVGIEHDWKRANEYVSREMNL